MLSFPFKKLSLLLAGVALIVAIMSSCDCTKKATNGNNTPPSSNHQLGDILQVNNSQVTTLSSEKLQVQIEKVAESRCPTGVNCITAGKAKVMLQVIKEGDMLSTVTLNAKGLCQKTDGSCGDSAKAMGYKFTLLYLSPYPGEDGKTSIPQDKYIAHIKIEK